MRSWLLAPDGTWIEVSQWTEHLGEDPSQWDWELMASLINGPGERPDVGAPLVANRSSLAYVPGRIEDRWMVNRVWDAVCEAGVDHVTAVPVLPGQPNQWVEALRRFTGCTEHEPQSAWSQRRGRWLLWLHTLSSGTPSLDGERIVVGAVPHGQNPW